MKTKIVVSYKARSICGAIFMAAAIATSPLYAEVLGVWKIDVDMTLNFNKKYAQLSEHESLFIKCFSENSSIEINKNYFVFSTSEHKCNLVGTYIDTSQVEYQYRTLYENDEVTILLSTLEDGTDFSQILYKIDDSLLWVYDSGESPEYDSHIRYYYKKMTNVETDSK